MVSEKCFGKFKIQASGGFGMQFIENHLKYREKLKKNREFWFIRATNEVGSKQIHNMGLMNFFSNLCRSSSDICFCFLYYLMYWLFNHRLPRIGVYFLYPLVIFILRRTRRVFFCVKLLKFV